MRIGGAVVASLLLGACATPRDGTVSGADAATPAQDASPVRSGAIEDPLSAQRAFWREVAQEKGTVPEGRTAAEWARELDPWLASTDPELRDDLAYTILAGWIVRGKIEDEPLRDLAVKWRADLGRAGTRDEDVVARSFAALTLSVVVAWENRHPFLGEDEVARIRAAATSYSRSEHDVRGYDPVLGWVHATAHAADLLKFLARERGLPQPEQAAFLAAIDAKAALPGAVWSAGEDLRLARVALSIVARDDFDAAAFEGWIAGYERAQRELWATPRVDPARLAEVGNRRRVLAELAVLLAVAVEPQHVDARQRVLSALASTG